MATDKIIAMQAFVRVVQTGTFTKAAESLGMEKSQVSRLVQLLETQLSTKLLTRTTRRMMLTTEGAQYFEGALRLLSDIDELESSMSSSTGVPRGKIRVDTIASVAQRLILPNLHKFQERYPEIRLDLGVSDKPIDLIGENVDCAIRGGEISDQSLVARRIGTLPTIMCASPEYVKRRGVPKQPLELEGPQHCVVNYFSTITGKNFPFVFERGDERVVLQPSSAIGVNDAGTNLAAGLCGLGVIRVSRLMVEPYLQDGRLQPVLTDWTSIRIPIYLVYPPNRHLAARVRAFADWMIELFAALEEKRPAAKGDRRAVLEY